MRLLFSVNEQVFCCLVQQDPLPSSAFSMSPIPNYYSEQWTTKKAEPCVHN